MNSSIYSADRATHQRVVAVALLISIAIVGFAISARVTSMNNLHAMARPGVVVKVETPGRQATAIRQAARQI